MTMIKGQFPPLVGSILFLMNATMMTHQKTSTLYEKIYTSNATQILGKSRSIKKYKKVSYLLHNR